MEFLYKLKEEWAILDLNLDMVPADDPEVKRDLAVNTVVKDEEMPPNMWPIILDKARNISGWVSEVKGIHLLLGQKRKEWHASLVRTIWRFKGPWVPWDNMVLILKGSFSVPSMFFLTLA